MAGATMVWSSAARNMAIRMPMMMRSLSWSEIGATGAAGVAAGVIGAGIVTFSVGPDDRR
jgi:hypothetical protein